MIYNFIVWQCSNKVWCLRVCSGAGEVIAEGVAPNRIAAELMGIEVVAQALGVH